MHRKAYITADGMSVPMKFDTTAIIFVGVVAIAGIFYINFNSYRVPDKDTHVKNMAGEVYISEFEDGMGTEETDSLFQQKVVQIKNEDFFSNNFAKRSAPNKVSGSIQFEKKSLEKNKETQFKSFIGRSP